MKIQLTVTKLFPSGAWEVFAIYKNELHRKVYFGYNKREVVRLFKEELKAV